MVPRSARRGFDEPHFSVKFLTATSAAACVSSTKLWLLIRSSNDQLRLSECWQITTVATLSALSRDLKLFCTSLNYVQNEMSGYISSMQKAPVLDKFCENWCVTASKKAVVLLDHHNTQRGEAQLSYKNGSHSRDRAVGGSSQLRAFSCPRHGYSSVCQPPTPTNVLQG